jgi:hypothetical protein
VATRFYLTNGDPQGLSPAFDASWDLTSSATRVGMKTFVRSRAFANASVTEASTSGTFDVLIRQYVSDPIAAVTISGTVKGIIRVLEDATDADFRSQMVIRVLSYDCSTVRGTLIASDGGALVSEWDATTLTNRKFPLAWAGSGTSVTSVAAQDGDRIVIEVGYRSHNVTATGKTGTMRFGDASLSDLAEDETSTVDNNPWVEFSDTITFLDLSTARRGVGNDLFVELGSQSSGPEDGRGNSYAELAVTDEAITVPTEVKKRGNDLIKRIGIGIGPIDGRGDSYEIRGFTADGAIVPSLKRPGPIPGSETGSGELIVYEMQAKDSVTGVVFTWQGNQPDFAGSGYPGPNLPLQISIRQTSRPQC